MKFISILIATLMAIAPFAAHAHSEHGQPQYGGIVGEAGMLQMELVVKEAQITIYVTHHGDPVSTKNATGKLTLLGTEGKIDATLAPAGNNQLAAKLKAKPAKGSKMVVSITLADKSTASVRFVME